MTFMRQNEHDALLDGAAAQRRARERRALWRMSQFFALAILVHLTTLQGVDAVWSDPLPPDARPRKVRLIAMSGASSKMARLPKMRTAAEIEQEEKKREDSKRLKGQVVDLPPSPDSTPPEDAKYLSAYNTRTERETSSRNKAQQVYENAMNEVSAARRSEAATPQQKRQAAALDIGPITKNQEPAKKPAGQATVFELPDIKQRDRLALALDPKLGKLKNQVESDAIKGKGERLRLALGKEIEDPRESGTAPKQAPPVLDLVPAVGVLSRLSGAPANDHLENIDEGEGTFLNSREFKYHSFFNRMKRGVSQHWNPWSEYRRRDPTGNVYGFRSRVTVLNVTLDATGGLKELTVAQSSGLEFLDQEAMAAFRRAEPFPNPPKGLLTGEGQINFPFGFHIEFSRSGAVLPF
ncbi:MAG: TonB family protein [Deltaproteobacteria bacterium]|nr:TonB family protein [Deltaproteobacteria bacterium]